MPSGSLPLPAWPAPTVLVGPAPAGAAEPDSGGSGPTRALASAHRWRCQPSSQTTMGPGPIEEPPRACPAKKPLWVRPFAGTVDWAIQAAIVPVSAAIRRSSTLARHGPVQAATVTQTAQRPIRTEPATRRPAPRPDVYKRQEQDELVRADASRTVCVQGAPGTGKTAVGLHRAAWLLYAHRDRLARSGVLVIGPNRAFLDHIGALLPALGEVAVRHTTCPLYTSRCV